MNINEFLFYHNDLKQQTKDFISEYEVILKDKSGNVFEFCSNNCEFLNLNEREQNLYHSKEDHKCTKYNVTLKHENFHPLLLKCEECKNESI